MTVMDQAFWTLVFLFLIPWDGSSHYVNAQEMNLKSNLGNVTWNPPFLPIHQNNNSRISSDYSADELLLLSHAKKIVITLKNILDVEAGVTKMQMLYGSTAFHVIDRSRKTDLENLARQILDKMKMYKTAIFNSAKNIATSWKPLDFSNGTLAFQTKWNNIWAQVRRPVTIPQCNHIPSNVGITYEMYGDLPVLLDRICLISSTANGPLPQETLEFVQTISQEFLEPKQGLWNAKWQYAMSVEYENHGSSPRNFSFSLVEHPGHSPKDASLHIAGRWALLDRHFRQRKARNVLLILDFPTEQLGFASIVRRIKNTAIALLEFLDHEDHIGLILRSDKVCRIVSCNTESTFESTEVEKHHLIEIVRRYNPQTEEPIHAPNSERLLCLNTFFEDRLPADWLLIYITHDRRNLGPETALMLSEVNKHRDFQLNFVFLATNPSKINTKFPELDSFAQTDNAHITWIELSEVFPYLVIAKILANHRNLTDIEENRVAYTDIRMDRSSIPPVLVMGMSTLVKRAHSHKSTIIQLVGVDLMLQEIAENFVYGSDDALLGTSYSFLINKRGEALMHPLLDRQSTHLVAINVLENFTGFPEISQIMLRVPVGNLTIPTGRTYAWMHLEDLPLIVCSFWHQNSTYKFQVLSENQLGIGELSPLVYHKSVEAGVPLPNQRMCRHADQVALTASCGLFLAAGLFTAPFEHIMRTETNVTIQGYLAYFNNQSDSSDPVKYLQPFAKAEVNLVRQICEGWMKQFHTSKLTDHLTRRFASTPSGVVVSFPATKMDSSYDPSEQEWFRRATNQPNQVTLTSPTEISSTTVTLSQAVYYTKRDFTNSTAVVVGLEITTTYLNRLLLDLNPECREGALRCFLMDTNGYIVAHPRLPEIYNTTTEIPKEKYHVTYMESVFATELLVHGSPFIVKKMCYQASAQLFHRYYKISIPEGQVISSGRLCSFYTMTALPGINVFLVILNTTCAKDDRAFCPCSLTDRICLNCERMGMSECECPCECLVDALAGRSTCAGLGEQEQLDGEVALNDEICPRKPSKVGFSSGKSGEMMEDLPNCISTACVGKKTRDACRKTGYCDWCALGEGWSRTVGWLVGWKESFCSYKGQCSGLVREGPLVDTNILDVNREKGRSPDDHETEVSSPVGPLTALVVTIALVFFISVYCFCNHRREEIVHAQLIPQDSSHIQVTYTGNEDDPSSYLLNKSSTKVGTGYSNPANALLDTQDEAAPYQVTHTPYRFPRAPLSTDQGYSSGVTAADDSETQSLVGVTGRAERNSSARLCSRTKEKGLVRLVDLDDNDLGESDGDSFISRMVSTCSATTSPKSQRNSKNRPDVVTENLSQQHLIFADVHSECLS